MSDWNDFLARATRANNTVELGSVELSSDNTYFMLLRQGILSITGPDAAKFLQGQVTCDVRELANNKTLLGAQCSIKGRMLLCFRALQSNNEQILLRVNKALVPNGLANLGKYIVFSKAKLADATPDYYCFGIAGPKATQIIRDVFSIDALERDHWHAAGDHKIIRIDDQRYECWITAADAEKTWHQLRAHATDTSENLWNWLNIQAGIGDITLETYDRFTPQAINFQLVNGINFRKGCYTGQEIVARLHYRGTLKRHMYRFEFTLIDNALPQPGSALLNAEGKNVGEVIISAAKNATSGELLASVVDDERVAIYLENIPQKLSLLALPYAIPTPNEAD